MRAVLLDFETTGLDPVESEIIEIGALEIQIDGSQIIAGKRYHSLVKPVGSVPLEITRLTGISSAMLESERSLGDLASEFLAFLGDSPLIAHNASLEQKFLDHALSPFLPDGRIFDVHNSIEPIALVLPTAPSLSLEALRKWAGVSLEGAHRADQDCEALLQVLLRVQGDLQTRRPRVQKLVTEVLGSSWWWSWFFEDGDSIAHPRDWLPLLERPFLGDLKELKSKDSERPAETGTVSPEILGSVIRGERLAPEAEGDSQVRFTARPAQHQMASAISEALQKGARIAIEAPTGTGKSVGYLIPGILAAESQQAPLVVATHSKALQDQLLEKDVPLSAKLLGRSSVRAATVKGQQNYLCLRKLHELLESRGPDSSLDERLSMAYLVSFANASAVAELDRISPYLRNSIQSLPEHIDWIRSHHSTTLGPPCPYYRSCHFFDSARIAHGSDVIISNHALVFQWPQHLPQIRNVIFDEAHHLEDQITDAFSAELSEQELTEMLDRFSRKRGTQRVGDVAAIARLLGHLRLIAPFSDLDISEFLQGAVDSVRGKLVHLRSLAPLALGKSRDSSDGYEIALEIGNPHLKHTDLLRDALASIRAELRKICDLLEAGLEACSRNDGKSWQADLPAVDVLKTATLRFQEAEAPLAMLFGENLPEQESDTTNETSSRAENFLRLFHWDPRESTWRVSIAPIDVRPLARSYFQAKRAVVLTSATLSSGSQPTFVTDRIGLELTLPLTQLPSPYNLERQAEALFPKDIAPPGTPSHFEALLEFTERAVLALEGRTLLLLSSNRRLRAAAEKLRERLEPRGIQVFDSLSDRRAADAFRAAERALLIGGERYGEGLDLPGRQLSLVIIEKINESMTRSPLAEARKTRTRFALFDYDFPLRMMWLKQRVGRLIRSATDWGTVVVFDSRFYGWSEGSKNHVRRALTPIPIRTGTPEELLGFLEERDGRGG